MLARKETLITGISIVLCSLATIYGLVQMPWPEALPWEGGATGSLVRYGVFLSIITIMMIIGSRITGFNSRLTGLCVSIMIALMANALWPFIVTVWFFVAAYLVGRSIRCWLQDSDHEKGWVANIIVGSGVYGTGIGLTAYFPIHYPCIYGFALAAPILLGRHVVAQYIAIVRSWFKFHEKWEIESFFLNTGISVVCLFYFTVAFLPEVGWDALTTHLFLPSQLAFMHRWEFDVSKYVWTFMPLLADWILSIGYMLGGETAARLINVGFVFLLARLVYEIVIWAGGEGNSPRWGVLLFLSTPLTFTEGSGLNIEAIWGSFIVAGTYSLLRYCSRERVAKGLPLSTGILLGFALAAKAITFPLLCVLILLMVFGYRGWFRKKKLTPLFSGICILVLLGAIPYVTAWLMTGNPVFPFFNGIFESPYFPNKNFKGPPQFSQGSSFDLLYRITFHSSEYLEAKDGAAGFQWILLLFPASLGMLINRHRRGLALLFVGILFVLAVFHFTNYLRYVFPAWPILSAVIGLAFSSIFRKHPYVFKEAFIVATITIILNLIFINASQRYYALSLRPLTSTADRERYIEKVKPIRSAVEAVSRMNADRRPVIILAQPAIAGLNADALMPNWYNYRFAKQINSIRTEEEAISAILTNKADFLILDKNWKPQKVASLFEGVTDKITEFGPISIRKLKNEFHFQKELSRNSDFSSIDGWRMSSGAKHYSKERFVSVSANSPVYQKIPVSGGHRFKNIVVARCGQTPTIGRLQVNWLNADSKFISTNIRTFKCDEDWKEYDMEVISPDEAVTAVVYTITGYSIFMDFKTNSFKM